jgi:hypothetical protein
LPGGPQVAFGEVERGHGWIPGRAKFKCPGGSGRELRVTGRLDPPAYSLDGEFACLRMTRVSWSIHSAELVFFLERSPQGWSVVHVRAVSFV